MATPERAVIESMFKVVNKRQEDVDFILNTAQCTVDNNWAQRLIIPKARQEGMSTYFLSRQTVRCLGRKNTRAVVISHDTESTEKMLDKVKYFLENLKGPKAVIKNSNKNEITFPKTNSMFYIGTAGSRAFGRGDTITDLHCSEVAYWPNAKLLMSGLLAAVPKSTGCVSIESTGNGAGDYYHSACMRAFKKQSTFKLIFLPWWDFPEYTLQLSQEEAEFFMASLREDIAEQEMLKSYPHLTPGQLAWRRMIIEDEADGDLYLWNKEYPSCLDDCFQIAGGGIFQRVNFVETPDWKQDVDDPRLHRLAGHPHKNLHYVIGGDVAAGVRKDNSVAEIFCLETEEQVGEWVSNTIEPDIFAHKLADLGFLFNEAYIGVESNNHGILTLKELTSHSHESGKLRYPPSKVYRTPGKRRNTTGDDVKRVIDLGVRTTVSSKPYIIGLLRKKLSASATIHSPLLKNELTTYIEHENGEMGAAENCHDDTVMACGMCFFVFNKAGISLLDAPITVAELPIEKTNPHSFEAILKELGRSTDGTKKSSIFPDYLRLH